MVMPIRLYHGHSSTSHTARRRQSDNAVRCKPKRCLCITLVASLSLLIRVNILFLLSMPETKRDDDIMMIEWRNSRPLMTPKAVRRQSTKQQQQQQQQQNLSIVVQLVGAFGNQLSLLYMGLLVISIAKRRGFQETSIHIKSEDGNHIGKYDHLWYNEEERDIQRRACKQCFPNIRNMMFLEGNEPNFKDYMKEHDKVLGPELAKMVRIDRFTSWRDPNGIVADIEKSLETVQNVLRNGTLTTLESGQWNSTFKKGTVLGPYSFPMIIVSQLPLWPLYGMLYDELKDFFQVDEDCYMVQAQPDEVVYYYRNFEEMKCPEKPFNDEMSFDSIATNILGHLKGGKDKLAIVTRRRPTVKPLIKIMRANNITVRAITTKSFLDDFFFLLSAKRELIGRGESTFFQFATLLNSNPKLKSRVYFVDNGSEKKHRFFPEEFPPSIENLELKDRLQFELYRI